MKRKGFTLIELLAVIVMLAVIALISTPMILGIIEKAKKGGAESSALGYIDAVEKTIATNMLDTNKTNIEDGVYEVSKLKSEAYSVKVKGEEPTDDSWVKVEKGQVTACSLKIGEYIINCNGETIKNGEITTKPDGEVGKTGPTKVEASEADTHKGIIYLDPTNLSNVCNAENSVSTTGTKIGCMKWYIYSEDDSNYTMILDHNTTAKIAWDDNKKNVSYEESNLYAVVQDLKTTSGWVVDPRLITTEEINNITGKTGFDSTNSSSWYYFDSKSQTQSVTGKGESKYAWLFDYTYSCEDFGCNINDKSNYGYWTSTTRGIAGSGAYVWGINMLGNVYSNDANDASSYGIRPVITINKSIIS